MRKMVLILFLLLTFSFVKAEAKEMPVTTTENQTGADITLLQNKVGALEQKFIVVDKDFDRILQTSQHIWANILTAVLAITAVLLGGSLFNTFFYVRTKTNKTEESLKNEIAGKVKEIKKEFEDTVNVGFNKLKEEVDTKFNKLKGEYDTRFDTLEAGIFDAIGRTYENNSPEVGAIWFARCIDVYMDSQKFPNLNKQTDEWIRIRMLWVAEYLKRGAKLLNPEHIAELQTVISKIDGNKYKAEKEEIQKVLQENINKPA